jgi:hypothetical protein
MPLFFGTPVCSLCQQAIEESEAGICTWGVPFSPPHPLYQFCESPLHLACLADWPQREEFSRGYYEMFRYGHEIGIGHILAQGPTWFLSCGPCGPDERPHYSQIVLAEWPIRLKMDGWDGWVSFLSGGFEGNLAGRCLAAAQAVVAQVRAIAATQEALDALHDAALERAAIRLENEVARILSDIHQADPRCHMAQKATLNRRGHLVLKLNREASEAELKAMLSVALQRFTQSFSGPWAAVTAAGPTGRRLIRASFRRDGEVEFFFFGPQKPAP